MNIRTSFILFSIQIYAITASAAIIDVPGTANIFGAGHTLAPEPGGGGGGTLPPGFLLPLGTGRSLTVSSVTGTITNSNGSQVIDPDGVIFSSTITSFGGISGFTSPRGLALVGVFLSDVEPADPAPASIDFNSIGIAFTILSPSIAQIFFIGDGKTGTGGGLLQTFQVPNGATRVFFGVADALGAAGPPGTFSDNGGTFTANATVTPEPTAVALAFCGAIALFPRRNRNDRNG